MTERTQDCLMRMGFPKLSPRAGLSLIELLCVIAIIGILAGLVAGPATKALGRVRGWDLESKLSTFAGDFERQLRRHYAGKDEYAPASLAQLQAEGVLLPSQVQMFSKHEDWLTYYPFSSSDPEEKVVLRIRKGANELGLLTKKHVTAAD